MIVLLYRVEGKYPMSYFPLLAIVYPVLAILCILYMFRDFLFTDEQEYSFEVGRLSIHNKVQWDLMDAYRPLVCFHWYIKDGSKRILCI